MNASFAHWLDPAVERLGWTLVHFLWQGAVIAFIYGAARAALRGRPATWRYGAGCAALAAMALLPVLTLMRIEVVRHMPSGGTGGAATTGTVAGASAGSETTGLVAAAADVWGTSIRTLADAFEPLLPVAVGAWLIGLVVCGGRLVGACSALKRLQRERLEPVAADLVTRLAYLRHRMQVSRPVKLFWSAMVEVPTVIGWFRPVILLPTSCLTGLTPVQIDLLLAHELAHVRRHDFWVNLFQVMLETVLFYHPAVWWVSRCMREDREVCCDDLAVRACGNRVAYAQALTAMEELRLSGATLALAASGGSLLDRIRHVLGLNDPNAANWRRSAGRSLMFAGAITLSVGVALVCLSPLRYVASTRMIVGAGSHGVNMHDLFTGRAGNLPYDPYFIQTEWEKVKPAAKLGWIPFDPYFIQTQFELVQSVVVLDQVARDLQLDRRWSDRVGRGDAPFSWGETVKELRRRLEVRQIRNTSLIEIRVAGDEAQEAAEIANAIAEVHQRQSLDLSQGPARKALSQFQEKYHEQERVVTNLQAGLYELRRGLDIPDSIADQVGLTNATDPEILRRLESERIIAETQSKTYEARFEELSAMSSRDLRKAMLAIYFDPALATLLSDLSSAEQMLAERAKQITEEHPDHKKLLALVKTINDQLDERVSTLMKGIHSQLQVQRTTVLRLNETIQELRRRDATVAAKYQPYFKLKRDLDTESQVLQVMRFKLMQEQLNLHQLQKPVAIVERAEPPANAVRSHARWGTILVFLGVGMGLLGVAVGFGWRSSPRLNPVAA